MKWSCDECRFVGFTPDIVPVLAQRPVFSIAAINILEPKKGCESVSINLDHYLERGDPMKSDYPRPQMPFEINEEIAAPSSRLLDEKISDESGTETTPDSALAPAGLKNPFWN
jgi:hypothetical protein